MTVDDIVKYYGNQTKACEAIGLGRASFSKWLKQGYIPLVSQLRFEKQTNGKLIANLNDMRKGGRVKNN